MILRKDISIAAIIILLVGAAWFLGDSFSGSNVATTAKLDSLKDMRASMDIAGIASCNKHQGADCEAGPDIDGSVICKDNFRAAVERYTSTCKYFEPVKVLSVSKKLLDGTYAVLLKNNTTNPQSEISLMQKSSGKQMKFVGPEIIEAGKTAVYRISLENSDMDLNVGDLLVR